MITITNQQAEVFNRMLHTLRMIGGNKSEPTTFMTADELRKSDEAKFMGFEEVIEMAYENMQGQAKECVKGIREIKLDQS